MNKSIQNVNTVKLTLISFQPHLHSVTQVVQRGHRYTYIYPHCVYSPLLHFKKIFQVTMATDSEFTLFNSKPEFRSSESCY